MNETNHLRIGGMHCAACASRIEKAVSTLDGVSSITVHLPTEKARVTFHNNRTTLSQIIDKIHTIGFDASILNDHSASSDELKQRDIRNLQKKVLVSILLTIPLAWSMFTHFTWASFMYIPPLFTNAVFQLALAIPIQFIIGYPFYERAWKAIKSGSANMDVLVVLSTSAAFFYSHYLTMTSFHTTDPVVLYYETSAFIITFILIGKLLEAKTKVKTTASIKNLYHLQTKMATVYKNGKEVQTYVNELVPGDTVLLKPGDKVPIDGQVIEGVSFVDESLLTGESVPIEKSIGHSIYAGTMNHHSVLKIHVTKKESETVLAHIIRIVEDAQTVKAPIQRIADRVVRVFVPIVIGIAAITFVLWYMYLQPGNGSEALEKVIAVLIIACPCALGLATPTSVMVGSGRAAQFGILFKEGTFLELLGKCKNVIFDKTGTLTKGTPHITDIYIDQMNDRTFLEMIGAVEKNSDHPIAKAIVKEATTHVTSLPNAQHVVSIPGHGVRASVHGADVVIANRSFFSQNNHYLPVKAKNTLTQLEEEGKTVMIVFIQAAFAGIIAVADEIKPSAMNVVSRLQQMGCTIGMLTGDNYGAAKAVANNIGIQYVEAEATPQEKAAFIEHIQKDGRKTIMVGDGINDAPALAVATVGVAIGTGSDIAIDSGDVTIIKGDVERLIDAMTLSKKTMANIKQNLGWAFLYNIIMIPFAMLGFLAPWLAGAAMALSSISVVLNALRLNNVTP